MPERNGIDFDKTTQYTIAITPKKVKVSDHFLKIKISVVASLTALSVSAFVFLKTTQNPNYEKLALQYEDEQNPVKKTVKRVPAQFIQSNSNVERPAPPTMEFSSHVDTVAPQHNYPEEDLNQTEYGVEEDRYSTPTGYEKMVQAQEENRKHEEQADISRIEPDDRYPASDDENHIQPTEPAVMEFKAEDPLQHQSEEPTF